MAELKEEPTKEKPKVKPDRWKKEFNLCLNHINHCKERVIESYVFISSHTEKDGRIHIGDLETEAERIRNGMSEVSDIIDDLKLDYDNMTIMECIYYIVRHRTTGELWDAMEKLHDYGRIRSRIKVYGKCENNNDYINGGMPKYERINYYLNMFQER
jgi:hypothetical protein